MAKKSVYEPHRRLATKTVPSGTDYDRVQNQTAIDAEIQAYEDEFADDIQAEMTEQNLAEHVMHITGEYL